MLFEAVVDSPRMPASRSNFAKKRHASLGRFDSGIDLDIGLGDAPNGIICPEDFIAFRKGDVFKPLDAPIEKQLMFVEKVENVADDNCDGVFSLDINGNTDVVKGYIPTKCVVMKSKQGFETTKSHQMSASSPSRSDVTLPEDALIKKLEAENSQLRAQLLELKITNDSLVESLSWNGDDDLGVGHLQVFDSPRSIRSPRLVRSPRPLRSRSRTLRSDCLDAETDAFFKVLDTSMEKKEDVDDEDILLSCTLCSRKIRMVELEIHSKVCSSAVSAASNAPKLPNMLVTSVTQVTFSSCTDQLLKIITKTTLDVYAGHYFEVNRTIADFLWFRETLQELCPCRIVPSIVLHGNVDGNFREIHRFLRRLTTHKALKVHEFVRLFLTEKDSDHVKEQYEHKKVKRTISSPRQPDSVAVDENSLLCRAQVYISSLLQSLQGITDYMRESMNKDVINDDISNKFKNLSDVEIKETYLKIATSGLSRITQESAVYKEEDHEALLVEELESVIGSVKEAQKLLERVKVKMNNFLYWEERMKIYEQQNDNRERNADTKLSCTKKWAEASANCISAKQSLENICKHVSEELANFDFVKEQELKEILIDFADGKFHHYEKLQSKWYGVRIMLDADILPGNRAFDMT